MAHGGIERIASENPGHPRRLQPRPDHLVRLSIGIEHIDDILADLGQALEAAKG